MRQHGTVWLASAAFVVMAGCTPPGDVSVGETAAALGGTTRTLASGRVYQLYVPSSTLLDPPSTRLEVNRRRPLVLFLHGFGGSLASVEQTDLVAKGQQEGFIVAALQGTPCDPTGEDGTCPDDNGDGIGDQNAWNNYIAPNTGVEADDLQYVLDVIADVKTQTKVNRRRIYATGQSNGGMMAYRLAANLPTTLAAVGVVSGAIGLDYQCDPECYEDTRCPHACNYDAPHTAPHTCDTIMMEAAQGPISVAIIHGELDDHLWADGALGECSTTPPTAPGLDAVPLQDAVDFWVAADNCASSAEIANTSIERARYYDCDQSTEVVRWLVLGMKHEWQVSSSTSSFSTNTALWNFFKHHHL